VSESAQRSPAIAAPERARPTISVVIASCREPRLLEDCLRSILPQAAICAAEVVVARAGEPDDLSALVERYPSVRFVEAPAGSGIPELRGLGMKNADGDIVALTEDHCVATPDWLDQLVRAQRGGADVAGGSMDNAQRARAIDWAAYFAEYGFFAGGTGKAAPGPEQPITGANVTYSRRVLSDVVRLAGMGEWENVAHDQLAAQGRSLRFVREATIAQNQNYHFWSFCRDRYEHGVSYARRRLVDRGGGRRLDYALGSFALPSVLLLRVARAVNPRHRWDFVRALPFTFAFLTAWSVGEAVGYLRGGALPRAADSRSL
jgi:GT2 family glycosyltransferase